MKKLDNYSKCLNVLKNADFNLADENKVYRMGIVGQFNRSFELAWKALQAVLSIHGVEKVKTGSPREILQLGYKHGFLDNPDVWLMMLKKRNLAIHTYNEEDLEELLMMIHDSFLPALTALEETLKEKLEKAGDDWA